MNQQNSNIGTTDAEWALIGTSPLMLIKAIELSQKGYSVLLIEKCEDWGGSWKTRNLWSYQGVEVSVHSIRNRAKVFRFLKDNFALNMKKFESYGFLGRWRIPLRWYRPLIMLPTLVKRALSFNISGLVDGKDETGIHIFLRAMRNIFVDFEYPNGGSRELLEKLRASLNIRTINTAVESIHISADRQTGVCKTVDGDVRFKHLILGSNMRGPIFLGPEEELKFETEDSELTNILLHLEGRKKVSFCYAEKRWDPIIRRIRDMGMMAIPKPSAGRELIGVSLHRHFVAQTDNDQTLAELVTNQLVLTGFLDSAPKILDFHIERTGIRKITNRDIAMLNRLLKPAVEVQRTGDFGEELNSLLLDRN